jgi:hypothetical protein
LSSRQAFHPSTSDLSSAIYSSLVTECYPRYNLVRLGISLPALWLPVLVQMNLPCFRSLPIQRISPLLDTIAAPEIIQPAAVQEPDFPDFSGPD